MVNQAEGLIRETFQKLGDTLGIHIDIPDEMIANLAAALQTEIDRLEAAVEDESFSFLNELAGAFRSGESNPRPSHFPVLEGVRAVLAHLTAAGRLIPADDETRLTAEQVEDVRTAREELRGYRNFDGNARGRVNRLIAAVDALFPATEPAEEVKPVKFRKMTAKYATANFGFPDVTDPFTRWAYKDSDGDKWAWNGDQWELHIVPPSPAEPAEVNGNLSEIPNSSPAPAEPAEEETTADPWTVQLPEGMTMEQWIESLPDEAPGLLAAVREVRERLGISSPVVPAPTETGPWQRIEDVPETVGRVTDRDGDVWEWDGDNWVTPETAILPTAYINKHYAPFVAAKER